MANTVQITSTLSAKGSITVQGSTTLSTGSGDVYGQVIDLTTDEWKPVNTGSVLSTTHYVFLKNQQSGSNVIIALSSSGGSQICQLGWNDAVCLKPTNYSTRWPYYASASIATSSLQVITLEIP